MTSNSIPYISVIIPVRNERAFIETCLRSILGQNPVAGGFELIVVDGMSTDGTREIIQQKFAADSRVRLEDNPQGIVPCALNIGIQAARGEIIVRLDAHTEYAPDYLSQCLQVLKETGADNVGGPARTKPTVYMQRAIAAAYHSPFSVGGAKFHNIDYEGYVDTVTYGCWYKKTLLQLGLFDEELVRNQDDELNLRITRSGGKIWQSPQIKSWYHPRTSLKKLFKQYFQYGYWKVRVIQKHRLPASWRHLVPGGFVLTVLINCALAPWSDMAAMLLKIQMGGYLLANGAAALLTAWKSGWSLLPILPLVFTCYHFGYGLGFLKGVWDFVLRRYGSSSSLRAVNR